MFAMEGGVRFLWICSLVGIVQSKISNHSTALDAVNASVRAGGQPLVARSPVPVALPCQGNEAALLMIAADTQPPDWI